MSATKTTSTPSIPFHLTPAQNLQTLRLLEVPEELLDIIVNTSQPLYFKSSPAATAIANRVGVQNGTEKEGNLHLCTEDKVWAVKQVSTSNSVFVARTVVRQGDVAVGDGVMAMDIDIVDVNGSNDNEVKDSMADAGLLAYAKPTSILELHAINPGTYEASVAEHLDRMVPTITSVEDINETGYRNGYSLRTLHEHIPAPTSVIEKVLARRCIFEVDHGNEGGSSTYAPSPSMLLTTWTELVNMAILNGMDLTDIDSVLRTLRDSDANMNGGNSQDQEQEYRSNLTPIHKIVIQRLLDPQNGHFASLGIISTTFTTTPSTAINQEPPSTSNPNPKLNAILNPRECTRWVGNLILSVYTSTPDTTSSTNPSPPTLPKQSFESRWEDTIPASWIKFCSVEVLAPSCRVHKDDHDRGHGEEVAVSWAPFVLEGDAERHNGTAGGSQNQVGKGGSNGAVTGAARPGGGGKNKRKWHEKFAAQRDARK